MTQPLDSATPEGRLNLHLLTSFAQFERELIGERTREKLAATRAKGLWQGTGAPLGYRVDHRQRLVVAVAPNLMLFLRVWALEPRRKLIREEVLYNYIKDGWDFPLCGASHDYCRRRTRFSDSATRTTSVRNRTTET